MSLRARFNEELKAAMLGKNQPKVSTIRLIMAALKERDIAARPQGVADGIADDQILSMMQGMIKQRRESIEMYEKGGRPELAEQEKGEIAIIETFLPQQMPESEAKSALDALIKEVEATSIKDLGKVMAEAKKRWPGLMDFSKASAYAREKLAS